MSTITKETLSKEALSIDMTAFKIILEKIAAQANFFDFNGSTPQEPDLPKGWVNLKMFKNSKTTPGISVVPSQGFLAKGSATQLDGSTVTVAVLALGITWPKYLAFQLDGGFPQMEIPKNIAGNSVPANAKMMSVYVKAYIDLRPNLWNALSKELKNLPLYICGMSLGAPLAQIAALDLRRGNFGPNNESPITTGVSCYTFSNGNTANQAMAAYYKTNALESNVVWAGSNLLQVDQFPLKPDNPDFTRLGNLDAISTPIPINGDESWRERGNTFYETALGGTPTRTAPVETTIPHSPAGFDQVLAYTLSTLTLASYKFAQHPGSNIPLGAYTKEYIINANGIPFAYVYSSSNAIVVAIRGCITWEEFNKYTANSNLTHPSFDPSPVASVQGGAYKIYTSPTGATGSTTFANDLRAKVRGLIGSKDLYITGHSLGGAIANIVAMDYVMSSPKLNVTAVYTIGSIMTGNADFAKDFSRELKNKTFQIVRTNDKITFATRVQGFASLDGKVVLNGELEDDELSHHALYSYSQLLDPSRRL